MRANIATCMVALAILAIFAGAKGVEAVEIKCPPTPVDSEGPFYKPDAPVRSSVGKGYLLAGAVKSAPDCADIAAARIEFWLAAPNGSYDDEHRATLLTDSSGRYAFESNFPPKYTFRPPHIHIRVTADGFRPLVTQHYPEKGSSKGDLVLVLVPE